METPRAGIQGSNHGSPDILKEIRAIDRITPRPFLILAAWEPPKPIHFWKGHQKSGRNGVVKIFPHPRGGGRKIFKV